MKIKTTMISQLPLFILQRVRSLTIANVRECESIFLLYIVGGNVNCDNHFEKQFSVILWSCIFIYSTTQKLLFKICTCEYVSVSVYKETRTRRHVQYYFISTVHNRKIMGATPMPTDRKMDNKLWYICTKNILCTAAKLN